jgi:hypothetical protein
MNNEIIIKSLIYLWTRRQFNEIFVFWPHTAWQDIAQAIKNCPQGIFIIIGYDYPPKEQYHYLDHWLTSNNITGTFFLLNEDFLQPIEITKNLRSIVPVGLCVNTISNIAYLIDLKYKIKEEFVINNDSTPGQWLCLTRTIRNHRQIVKENWIDRYPDDFVFSFGSDKFFGEIDFYNTIPNCSPEIANGLNFFSLKDVYNSACGSIVLETCAITPITEKTIHAILALHPFMLIANPGTIEYLRSQGFDVFDDIINHRYDNIDNIHSRIDCMFTDNLHLIKNKIDRSQILTRLLKNQKRVWHYYDNQLQHFEKTLLHYLK